MGFDFGGTFPPFSVTISDWVHSNDFDPFNAHRSGTLLLVDIYHFGCGSGSGTKKWMVYPDVVPLFSFHIHLPDILGRSRAQHPWTIFHIS